MNELISIGQSVIASNEVQTVNARHLHAALGVSKDFSDWFKVQVSRARLVEGRDFVSSPSKGSTGQNRIDYHLTLDAGKQVAMMSETDKGFDVRDYFLECERRALAAPSFAVPTTLSGALRLAAEQADTIEAQSLQIAAAAPAVEFVDKYVDSTGLKGFRQVCKLLGANESAFREFLLDEKIMYRLAGEWMPHAQHLDAGRFSVKAGTSDISGHAFNSARFTAKGVSWVAGEWAKYKISTVEF